jgi:hypothetical protein
MPRGDIFVPDLILTGDWHIDDDTPECRTDDYFEAEKCKLLWLAMIQAKYRCPVIAPGDVFNHGKADSELLNKVTRILQEFKYPILAVPGQHDLLNHSLQLQEKTAFENMVLNGLIQDVSQKGFMRDKPLDDLWITGTAWGREPSEETGAPRGGRAVLVWHTTTWERPFAPGQKPGEATKLLKKWNQYDLLVTGDNHMSFVCTDGKRKLVNCGSVARLRSDQKDFKPCIYLWQVSTGELRQMFFPIAEGVITDAKCAAEKERTERENAFVAKIEQGGEVSVSFLDNIQVLLKDEPTEVEQVVMGCVE